MNIDTVGSFSMNLFGGSGLGAAFCVLDTKKGIFLTPGIKDSFLRTSKYLGRIVLKAFSS